MLFRSTFLFFLIAIVVSCKTEKPEPLQQINSFLKTQADSLEIALVKLKGAADQMNESDAQQYFVQARKHYKRIEGILEFHFPVVSEAFNGPALPETEEYDDKVIDPTGFQVVEELIFPSLDTALSDKLKLETKTLVSMMGRLTGLLASNELNDQNVFEASRLEILRIISLGISGFDSPIAQLSIPEAKEALDGLQAILLCYKDKSDNNSQTEELTEYFQNAMQQLKESPDFNSFNRAEFIVDYLNPLSESIYKYQQALEVSNNKWLAPVDMNKTNMADATIFEADWFAPTYNRAIKNEEMVADLGKMLFFDPILSGNNSRACTSCHNPSNAFSDGRTKSRAFNFEGDIERNAPTVINSGFQKSQFLDSRVHFLEDQVTDVMRNAKEMHGQISETSQKLKASKEYTELFKKAFGINDNSQAISDERIQLALASYIRSLQSFNSRVDQYLRGKKEALTTDEIAGFNLSMGKAKCATCHFIPLFNGSIPPSYTETESEVLGVPVKFDTINARVDPDLGKFHTYNRELHKNAFKTTTLRNAALTAPYMHNGVYKTLEEVVDFYNRGGGAGIGIDLPNQTLPPDKLLLTEIEKKQIIAFIQALTDTVGLTRAPTRLPVLDDPKLNSRKIGGKY